jgi:dolichyl-phosphate beta-glucosyltransferase
MSDLTYSFILPAYNEHERLTTSLPQVLDYIQQNNLNAEVIVVNDGSSDDMATVVRGFAAEYPIVRLLENPGNRGKGYSVRNGVLHAKGDVILFTDSDLSSPIKEAGKLFDEVAAGADVAIGSRWLRRELQTEPQPWHRQLYGRLFNLALRIVLGLKYCDTQCGFKAFNRKAAQVVFPRQRIERWGFDPELLFLAQKFKLRVVEVPVRWAHDHRSKINPLRDGIRMALEVLKVRWNDVKGLYKQPSTALAESSVAEAEPAHLAK